MNRDELLRRSRNEAEDEGRDFVNRRGDLVGFTAMLVLSLALIAYKSSKGILFWDIIALPWAFLAAGLLPRYRAMKEKSTLVFGVVAALVCIGCLALYVWQTW